MAQHPRTRKVQLARLDIVESALSIAEREGLTFVELAQACADILQHAGKHALRAERHPNDPDMGADEA